jgi:hypothetical protein
VVLVSYAQYTCLGIVANYQGYPDVGMTGKIRYDLLSIGTGT